MESINPNLRLQRQRIPEPEQLLQGLRSEKVASLSQGLTLVESKLNRHRAAAEELIHLALPYTGNSLRIGITGVPGVGKSTFIEAFGEYLTRQGKKLAILAVDPSSAKTRGSILADKTRMEKLSQNPRAYIRPSPSSGSLGGVARRTRESILLCEAAGYDVIMVETVGVGQSETAVKSMVDFFMLLMLAGAGDELQGIKRGIMEMADLLVINKADDPKDKQVRLAMGEYKRALHLFPPNANGWIPKVLSASALYSRGIEDIWKTIESFYNQQKIQGHFDQNRKQQALQWFHEAIGDLVLETLNNNPIFRREKDALENQLKAGKLEAFAAAHQLVEKFLKG